MNTWKPESFLAKDIEKSMSAHNFTVPLYQRGLVWKDAQKERFVDTLKRGLPFGSILLYHDEVKNKYQIIDGLQRCTTIFEFINNPTMFFCEDDIDDAAISEIVAILGMGGNTTRQQEEIKLHLLRWVKTNHPTMQTVEDMQYSEFAYFLSAIYPTAKGKEQQIALAIKPLLHNYKSICKTMQSINIPAIVIKGDEDVLPEVFERINSSGSPLNKYAIFAATWTDKKYKIASPKLFEIVKFNCDRYEMMLSGAATLADFEAASFLKNKELNAFEIAFGLGKHLSKTYPHLFSRKDDITQIDSVGFSLINCCLGKKISETKNMNGWLENSIGNERINLFLERILQCVECVDKLVKKYNLFKANSRSIIGLLHTEYQILSMIALVFINRYATYAYNDKGLVDYFEICLDTSTPAWSSFELLFKKNAAKKYIQDILYQRWKGSGDKRLDSVLFDPEYYTREISNQEFEVMLWQWFYSDSAERNECKKFASPQEAEKLLLSVIYLPIFSAQAHLDGSAYDIEHLAPKGLMRKKLEKFDGVLRLPVSSIANLCLLPEKENRVKQDKTIYSDKKYLEASSYTLQDIETKFTFTKQEHLSWADDETLDAEAFKEKYMGFINLRFTELVNLIIKGFENN